MIMEIFKIIKNLNIIEILNIIGVIAFAISGSLKGLKHHLDILGVVILGIITAIGGGILRDVLLNETPSVLLKEADMYYAIITSIVIYILAQKVNNYVPVIKIFDAAGLAVFTVIGAQKGIEANLGFLGVIIMGTLTGVAGGVIRDMFVREVPFILKEEIYAMFCIVGGFILWILTKKLEFSLNLSIYIVILFIFIGRIIAIKFNLYLPKRFNEQSEFEINN